jgi:hypothetical protein
MYCQAGLFIFVSRNLSISAVPDIRNFKKLAFLRRNVLQEGVIYQKNLGKNTESIAKAMKKFDPDETWKKFEETSKEQ